MNKKKEKKRKKKKQEQEQEEEATGRNPCAGENILVGLRRKHLSPTMFYPPP